MSSPKKFDIETVVLDLSKIESILRTDSNEKETFLKNFRLWANQRRLTISQLRTLKIELDDICTKANIGKCIGTGLSVVGALASIVGFGLSLSSDESTSKAGKNIAKCGIGAGAIGGATSFVSSAAECTVNQRLLNQVKSTLERDQELTESLIPYLEKSEHLNSLFKEVFDCDILSDTKDDILTVFNGIITLCKQGKCTYDEISKALSSNINECTKTNELERIKKIFQISSEKVKFLLLEFCQNPKVREALLKILQPIEKSIGIEVSKICSQILQSISISPGCFSSDISLERLFNNIGKITHVFTKFISYAREIIKLIINAKDILNSESKYSKMVEDIKSFLQRELTEVSRIVNQASGN